MLRIPKRATTSSRGRPSPAACGGAATEGAYPAGGAVHLQKSDAADVMAVTDVPKVWRGNFSSRMRSVYGRTLP